MLELPATIWEKIEKQVRAMDWGRPYLADKRSQPEVEKMKSDMTDAEAEVMVEALSVVESIVVSAMDSQTHPDITTLIREATDEVALAIPKLRAAITALPPSLPPLESDVAPT